MIGLLVLMHATFVPQLKTAKQYLKSSTNQSSICVMFPTKTGQVYRARGCWARQKRIRKCVKSLDSSSQS